jgi:hypothetical protein
MVGKKKIFPGKSGKKPGRGGKKSIFFLGTNVVGTVVPRVQLLSKDNRRLYDQYREMQVQSKRDKHVERPTPVNSKARTKLSDLSPGDVLSASSTFEMIERLFLAGADLFRR